VFWLNSPLIRNLDFLFCCLDNFLISTNEFSRQRGSETKLCAVGRSLVMAGEELNSSARARAHKSISHLQYSPIVFRALTLNLTTLLVSCSWCKSVQNLTSSPGYPKI